MVKDAEFADHRKQVDETGRAKQRNRSTFKKTGRPRALEVRMVIRMQMRFCGGRTHKLFDWFFKNVHTPDVCARVAWDGGTGTQIPNSQFLFDSVAGHLVLHDKSRSR